MKKERGILYKTKDVEEEDKRVYNKKNVTLITIKLIVMYKSKV